MRDFTAVTIALAILALGFLIVVHEAGHYFVARWCKMRVERFSIGFGPGILKRRGKDGTIFQLAPIPFGGFVEIRGMNIAEEVDPDDVYAYPNRPVWQRFVTILAGPLTNYLSAIVLAFLLYNCHGIKGGTFYVGEVVKGSASEGKLLSSDRIVAIDGVDMYSPDTGRLSEVINAKKGQPLTFTVERGGQHGGPRVDVTIKPLAVDFDEVTGAKCFKIIPDDTFIRGYLAHKCKRKAVYQIGVLNYEDVVEVGVLTATKHALEYPVKQTALILGGFRDIFTGKEKMDAGGPIRIVGEFKKAFEAGWVYGISLVMMLSVYLGLFNLFPLPALDGGRLVFLGYEMVTRRRANPKIETMVHMGGIMVLMVVMLLVLVIDIRWLF